MRVSAALLVIASLAGRVMAESQVKEQAQGAMFDILVPGRDQRLPIIESCPEEFQISPLRPMSDYKGPAPAAPHTLVLLTREQLVDGAGIAYERIYSKSLSLGNLGTPFSVFPPWQAGSQFIACVWSSNSVSAGCQDLYTVTNATGPWRNNETYCMPERWVPSMEDRLEVDVEDTYGTLATNGWPATCSRLRFTPRSGTPPYTLLIAPANHPPTNITSSSSSSNHALNYTVSLTHGQAFFAAVYDAQGASFGPLHAGQSTDMTCFSSDSSRSRDKGLMAGSAIGGFVAGILMTAVATWLFLHKRNKRSKRDSIFSPLRTREDDTDAYPSVAPYPLAGPRDKLSRMTSGPISLYEPSTSSPPMNSEVNELSYRNDTYRRSVGLGDFGTGTLSSMGTLYNPHSETASRARRSERGVSDEHEHVERSTEHGHGSTASRNVYVVHSDAGPGNLTIELPAGASTVVELPPKYINGQEVSQDQILFTPPMKSPPTPQRNSYSPEAMARAQAQFAEKRRHLETE